MTQFNNKLIRSTVFSAMMVVVMFMNVANSATDSKDPTMIHTDQLAKVLAQAIAKPGVVIAACQIPASAELIPNDKGVIVEQNPNYSALAVALSLTKLKVVERLRGTCDSLIFVQYLSGINEAVYYSPFSATPNSKWLLFLASPLLPEHQANKWVTTKLANLTAADLLSPTNLFQIETLSYAAVCLEWPSGKPEPAGLMTAEPTFVSDLKLILQRQQERKINPKKPTAVEGFISQLKDPLAKKLIRILEPEPLTAPKSEEDR